MSTGEQRALQLWIWIYVTVLKAQTKLQMVVLVLTQVQITQARKNVFINANEKHGKNGCNISKNFNENLTKIACKILCDKESSTNYVHNSV